MQSSLKFLVFSCVVLFLNLVEGSNDTTCPTELPIGNIQLPDSIPGLKTCVPALFVELDSVLSTTPLCKDNGLGDILRLAGSVVSDPVVVKIIDLVQRAQDATNAFGTIDMVVEVLHSMKSEEIDGTCSLLSSALSPCLGAIIPKLFDIIRANECCSEFSSILDIATVLGVPEEVDNGIQGLLSTVLYDIEALVCSRTISNGESMTCAYNFIDALIISDSTSLVIPHALKLVENLMTIPVEDQCPAFKGEEIVVDGKNIQLWNIGGCSIGIDNVIRLLKRMPIMQMFRDMDIPLLGISVDNVLNWFINAPCCSFDNFSPATDHYSATAIASNCADDAGSKKCEEKSRLTDLLPKLIEDVPGIHQCFSSDDGASLRSMFRAVGKSPSCSIELITDVMDVSMVEKVTNSIGDIQAAFASGTISGVMQLLKLFEQIDNKDFQGVCNVLNQSILTCLSEFMPQVATLMGNHCCDGWSNLLESFHEIILTWEVYDAFQNGETTTPVLDLVTLILTRFNQLLCSTRTSDLQGDYCGYNMLHNLVGTGDISTALKYVQVMFKIPEEQQCSVLSGLPSQDGKQTMWNVGECASVYEGFMSTLRGIPAANIIKNYEIEALGIKIRNILDGWQEAPCCAFDTKIDLPEFKFDIELPQPSCRA